MIIVQIIDYSTHNLPATILLRQTFCKSPYCMSICKFTVQPSLADVILIHIQMKTEKSKYMTVSAY